MKVRLHRFLKTCLAVLAAGLVFVACRKENDAVELPKQPAGYQELLAAYQAGFKYLSCDYSGSTTVRFENGTVSIPPDGLKIQDCRSCAPRVVSLSPENKMWCLDGILSGVRYHEHLPDEQATVVYAYIDPYTLHLYISNGNVLDFPFDESLLPREFRMPIIRITHSGAEITREAYVEGSITIEDPDLAYSEAASFSASMRIKGRGKSTWSMPKKPYKIKLAENTSLLGMPGDKDWVLLANYADKSLMRNNIAMEVSRICGLKWTPQSRNVEVFLNGSYQGVYNLVEDKEVAKHKVNIGKKDCYLEMEEAFDEPLHFRTPHNVPIQVKEPENLSEEEWEKVRTYILDFEEALFGPDFTDPVKGYAAWIDVESFIDNYLVRELSKDIDGNLRKSSFLTLKKGSKLDFYHVWDFDLAFGNADYFPDGNNGPTGWWIKDYGSLSVRNTGWYHRLFQDPAFVRKVKDRWKALYPELTTVPAFLDKAVREMGDAPARNFKRWDILNIYVWPNVMVTGSYDQEVAYLQSFYTRRLSWMNDSLAGL